MENPAEVLNPFPATNPWHPISDAVQLKTLGKLAEELGEAQAAVARCIIQGVNEAHPETGMLNRLWLENELADVLANISLVIDHFTLNGPRMDQRALHKMVRLREWHRQV